MVRQCVWLSLLPHFEFGFVYCLLIWGMICAISGLLLMCSFTSFERFCVLCLCIFAYMFIMFDFEWEIYCKLKPNKALRSSVYVRSHVGWGGERNTLIFIRVWKPLPSRCVLKTLRGSPKRTIFASGRLGLLQMVLELDTGRCASEEALPQRG